jgi:hypothetical protein
MPDRPIVPRCCQNPNGAVHIGRKQFRLLPIHVGVGEKYRVVAGQLTVQVVRAAFSMTMNRTLPQAHVEHDVFGALEMIGLPKRSPLQRHQQHQIHFLGQLLGLKPGQGQGQCKASVQNPLQADPWSVGAPASRSAPLRSSQSAKCF